MGEGGGTIVHNRDHGSITAVHDVHSVHAASTTIISTCHLGELSYLLFFVFDNLFAAGTLLHKSTDKGVDDFLVRLTFLPRAYQ